MNEKFKFEDIPGYKNLYAITKNGMVWSYPKPCSSKKGKWLKPILMIQRQGRRKPRKTYSVSLYKNKRRKLWQIHTLVALTYVKNPDNKPQVNHKDGNPLNNYYKNLEWVSAKGNTAHAIKTGLTDFYSGKQNITRSKNGKKTGAVNGMKSRRKFTFVEAEYIRKIHEIGRISCLAISKVYGCASKTIDNICNYKTYLTEIPT